MIEIRIIIKGKSLNYLYSDKLAVEFDNYIKYFSFGISFESVIKLILK